MKYTQTIIASLILFLLTVSVGNSKPLPSLSIKMSWQGELVQEMPMTLTVSVFSHVSTDKLEIMLTLPDGVTMIDGVVKKVISIEKSKPAEQRYTVQIAKGTTGKITAEASVGSGGQTSFYAHSSLPVATSVIVNQKFSTRVEEKEKEKNYKIIKRNGELLREYVLP